MMMLLQRKNNVNNNNIEEEKIFLQKKSITLNVDNNNIFNNKIEKENTIFLQRTSRRPVSVRLLGRMENQHFQQGGLTI